MQTVSQSWKDNHNKTLVNEGLVEVSLEIADPDALLDASATDNGAVYISNTPQVVNTVDKSVEPYFTLERNLWLLDGTRKAIPENDLGDCGYIGESLSDSGGVFSNTAPELIIEFSKTHLNAIPAITIVWGRVFNEFARDFTITAYNGDNTVATKDVLDNTSIKSVVEMEISYYDRIVIKVLKWCLPHRRARIEDVFIGLHKVYSKSDLFSYKHSQSADPISTALPNAQVAFGVGNLDKSYNPHNPTSLTKYLMERQEVKTKYGYKLDDGSIEWIKGGTFYLSSWEAAQNDMVAQFTARDLFEFMSAEFVKGKWKGGYSLYELAEMLFVEANLPLNEDGSKKWHIDESLKDIIVTNALPLDTIANNLQTIANAGRCSMYQDRNGIIRIERLNTESTEYAITSSNSFTKSEITLSKPIKQVRVVVHHHFAGDGEGESLYSGTAYVNGTRDVWLYFSSPSAEEFGADGIGISNNGRINNIEYYTNACKLNITADGEVSIDVVDVMLSDSTTEVVVDFAESGEIITIDNPLISDHNEAVALGNWVGNYLNSRMTLSSEWRADPRLDVLDIITNVNEYNTKNVRMTNVSYSYNGAFSGNGEGRVI